MKKVLMLALLMCFLLVPAFADESDGSSVLQSERAYTMIDNIVEHYLQLPELEKLNAIVQQRLFAEYANSDGVVVPAGECYIVGTDVPAGIYRVTLSGKTAYELSELSVYTADGSLVSTFMVGTDFSDEIGKLYLSDGWLLTIRGTSVCFYPYTGLFH